MADEFYDISDDADTDLDAWPNCAVPDCENKACLWAGTGMCHPCSVRCVGRDEMERRFSATRNDEGGWNGEFAALSTSETGRP